MTIPVLLAAILLAATVFAGFIWSVAQMFYAEGALRLAQSAVVALILLIFTALSQDWPVTGIFAGLTLAVAAVFALILERGWARLLPLVHILFGLLVAAGLGRVAV